jgi:hypothetical protein
VRTNNRWIQERCTRVKPFESIQENGLFQVPKFLKSSEPSIVRVDRWQQIREFEDSDFGRFARERVELILAVGAGKDTWWKINISLTRTSGKSKARVVTTRET